VFLSSPLSVALLAIAAIAVLAPPIYRRWRPAT
jgi:hypothetical protein